MSDIVASSVEFAEPSCDLASLFDSGEQGVQLNAAAASYLAARKAREDADRALSDSNKSLAYAEAVLLRSLAAAGLTSVTLDNGVSLTQSKTVYYSAQAGSLDDQAFYSWLIERGGGDLVKSTMHHATFSKFCRELAEGGTVLHPVIKKAERTTVTMRK